jgi:hypothetical protein
MLQPANTAAVSGASISSTAFNTLITDICTEITNSLDRGGRSAMTAALPMGGNIITGHGTPLVSTDVPNKAYVDAIVASFFSTGDTKTTFKTVADTGWIMLNDGTFGSATSGSSTRANADTLALFTLFFNNIADADAPLLTSGGGATTRAAQVSASAAWAARWRIQSKRRRDRKRSLGEPERAWPTDLNRHLKRHCPRWHEHAGFDHAANDVSKLHGEIVGTP